MNGHSHGRANTFHGPKRQLLGNQAGRAAPAWKTNVLPQGVPSSAVGKGKQAQLDQGSKIFLSRLPVDVVEREVEELFKKTIGPLRESFLIYNSQGKSKGMAVVAFQRPGDASVAKAKYDGKVVDGRRPLKIELITDTTPAAAMRPPPTPSLLDRLGTRTNQQSTANLTTAQPSTYQPVQKARQHPQNLPALAIVPANTPIPPRRIRQKKGPRRIKKLQPVTKDLLDKEMEDYRAAADMSGL